MFYFVKCCLYNCSCCSIVSFASDHLPLFLFKCFNGIFQCLIFVGHVSCMNLTASPNYVHRGTQLTLTCDVGDSIINGTAKFRSNSGSLGSIKHDINNCYVNSSSTLCPSTCSCDENNNLMIWKYTPSSKPSSDQIFYCDFIGDSGSFTTSTTVKRAGMFI